MEMPCSGHRRGKPRHGSVLNQVGGDGKRGSGRLTWPSRPSNGHIHTEGNMAPLHSGAKVAYPSSQLHKQVKPGVQCNPGWVGRGGG